MAATVLSKEAIKAYSKHFIDGAWVEALGSETIDVINASTEEVMGRIPQGTPAKVAPAFAAGCTVVLKPMEIAPLTAFLFAEIVEEAGLPPGVFNVVNGTGPVVGEAIASHPDVDMVSFTGSTRAGGRVSELAVPRPPQAPFGGHKQSGNGRELGRYGLEKYLQVKSLLL